MPSRELSFFDPILDEGLQLQQANGVCDRGAILPGALGNFFLSELEFVHQTLEGAGCFDRVQVFALDVFHQRHFEREFVGNFANDNGNLGQAGALGRTPATLARNQLKATANRANYERLNDAAGLNGAGQFVESFLSETGARLEGTGIDKVNVNLER